MAELSVKDQLEGILSDFEALKRSFDIEDVEAMESFPTASAASVPTSPSAASRFLNSDKANEKQKVRSLSFAFSSNNNSLEAETQGSQRIAGSNSVLSPRSHTLNSSLSFNRGNTTRPSSHNHNASVIRAASFQGRSNPNTYSTATEQGSDNDSLYSSSSSLDYTTGWASITPGLHSSYLTPKGYNRTKFSQHPRNSFSHGTVFHSEVCNVFETELPSAIDTNLDLQGQGGEMVDGHHGKEHQVNLNGKIHNAGFLGEEIHTGPKSYNRQESVSVKRATSRSKETPTRRLNKFPLDLDSLVSPPPIAPTERHRELLKPQHPKPLWSYSDSQNPVSPPSTSASPSASLSSLDSSSDTPPPLALHYPFLPFASLSSSSPSLQLDVPPKTCHSPSARRTAHRKPEQQLPTGAQDVVSERQQQFTVRQGPSQSTEDSNVEKSPCSDTQSPATSEFESNKATSTVCTLATPPHIRSRTNWKEDMKGPSEFPPLPGCLQESGVYAKQVPDTCIDKPMENRQNTEKCSNEPHPAQDNDSKEPAAVWKAGPSKNEESVFQEEKEKATDEGQTSKETQQPEAGVKVEFLAELPEMNRISGTDLFGYVGIEAVLEQIKNKTVKAGFEFNLMVVGQSGLGKSTLVNTLFKSKVSRKSCTASFEESIYKTVKLRTISHVIEEKGVRMKLTVTDTPGFGDQINNKDCWEPIVKYINQQYEQYLQEELHVNRKRPIPDSRVHCCIYFLPATGHRLRPIDTEFMKRLGAIVSIVPVIAKADSLTIAEREDFKERLRQDIVANGISVYPQKGNDKDPEECLLNEQIRKIIPFAVVGTDQEHQVNGNKVLGRKTNWGIIEVENAAHCEFANLRDLLIRSHLQDLKDVTHNVHYENYRIGRLTESSIYSSIELGLPAWMQENGHNDKSEP